jgi:MSHA biogenesis protein MshP
MSLPHTSQRGFAAVAAIFLVVLLAALGGFMLTFANSQALTSAQDVQGVRAYWAARAGLEWAFANIQPTPAVCPNTTRTQMTGTVPATVNGFTLAVFCTRSTYTEAGTSFNIFLVESRASTGTVGSVGFIERSVSASLERP